jgi:hypothetical protein
MSYFAPNAKEIAAAYASWLEAEPWTIFGTLKFTDGQKISVERALELARVYWQRLDTIYFGAQVRRNNIRIERAVFLTNGPHGGERQCPLPFRCEPTSARNFPRHRYAYLGAAGQVV